MVAVITAPEEGNPPVSPLTGSLTESPIEHISPIDSIPETVEPPQTPPPKKRRVPRQTRQTVQWPFQSTSLEENVLPEMSEIPPPVPILPGPNKFVSDAMMPSPKVAYFPRLNTTSRPAPIRPARPLTWQPRARIPKGFGNSTFDESEEEEKEKVSIRRSLIPDYVINYLRGDTPETIAQRAQEKEDKKKDGAASAIHEETAHALEGLGVSEANLRGGGSPFPNGDIDHTNLHSPAFRTSDEPILVNGRGQYAYGAYTDKRRSVMSMGRRRAQKKSGQGNFFARGWRAGMALHALAAIVLFITGLICLVLALTSTSSSDATTIPGQIAVFSCIQDDGEDSVCSSAYQVAWILRAVLAACTVVILSGAQYTFQVLSSPTRAEIDVAHLGIPTGLLAPRRNRQWLDIGVPSLRNIAFLLRNRKSPVNGGSGGRFRAVLAIFAVVTALVTSVLYGSLVDITITTPLGARPTYNVLLVAPSFFDGAAFSNSTANNAGGLDRLTILQLQQAASKSQSPLKNLTTDDCLRNQSSSALQNELSLFESATSWNNVSAVLVVFNDASVTALKAGNSSVVQTAPSGSILEKSDNSANSDATDDSVVFELDKSLSANERSVVIFDVDTVAYCLVQEITADTTANDQNTTYNTTVNTSLLAATIGLNAATIICFAFALLRNTNPSFRETPLITFGDAVASFLRDPDHTTRGACLLSKKDVKNGVWNRMADVAQLTVKTNQSRDGTRDGMRDLAHLTGLGSKQPENIMQPMFIAPKAGDSSADYYWFRSVSGVQWITGTAIWWTLAGLSVGGLAVSISKNDNIGSFGQFDLPDFIWGIFVSPTTGNTSNPVSSYATLLASVPQLGLGILYFVVDAHLSSYFLSHESSTYIANQNIFDDIQQKQSLSGRRALRVSYRPRGHQTTSIYLTLPFFWNLTLMVLFAGLSFALGQSIIATGLASTADSSQLVLLGFSATGLIVLVVLLLITAMLVLGLGGRRTPPPPGSLAVGAMRAASSPTAPPPARRNPLTLAGGSCSAVISARCHPIPEEMPTESTSPNPISSSIGGPLPLWLLPLSWGPTPSYQHPYQGYNRRHVQPHAGSDSGEDDNIDTIVGHCTFSNGPLVPLDTARSYA